MKDTLTMHLATMTGDQLLGLSYRVQELQRKRAWRDSTSRHAEIARAESEMERIAEQVVEILYSFEDNTQ